jgi:hypothetical protein
MVILLLGCQGLKNETRLSSMLIRQYNYSSVLKTHRVLRHSDVRLVIISLLYSPTSRNDWSEKESTSIYSPSRFNSRLAIQTRMIATWMQEVVDTPVQCQHVFVHLNQSGVKSPKLRKMLTQKSRWHQLPDRSYKLEWLNMRRKWKLINKICHAYVSPH